MAIRWRRHSLAVRVQRWGALAIGALVAGACIARSGELPKPIDLEGDAPAVVLDASTGEEPLSNLPPADPHALIGIEPPHGSPAGGHTALVRGNGFTPTSRVWLGETELDAEAVATVDATRLQILTPPGAPGTVDLTVQAGDDPSTRRTLSHAYTYDAFTVTPAKGPTGGGTRVALEGPGLGSDPAVLEISIDRQTCDDLEIASESRVLCTTPPGTPGLKPITVEVGGASFTVLDAFTYADSEDGFRGGLGGGALDDSLTVLVLDRYSGDVLPGAFVVLDDDLTTATTTDGSGRAQLANSGGRTTRTVTAAATCHQPMTLVDVPVDQLTFYLDPVLIPSCGERNELPAVGGASYPKTLVEGELLWPQVNEFQHPPFGNVPSPGNEGAVRAAYVFTASSSEAPRFVLPHPEQAITEADLGDLGSAFSIEVSPGTHTLYALAGIEDRTVSPARFTAYALGLTRGVVASLDATTREVFIDVVLPMDHALELDVTGPTPTSRGPDRVIATVAVRVGSGETLPVPIGPLTRLLPLTEPIRFVGLPPLIGPLTGASYVSSVRAVTGSAEGEPSSELGLFTGDPAETWGIDGFLDLPTLVTPEPNAAWDGATLALGAPAAARTPSFTVVELSSGGELVTWTVVLPGGVTSTALPALAALGDNLGLIPGPLTVVVTAVVVPDFDYSAWSYADLSARRWEAHAEDVFYVRY